VADEAPVVRVAVVDHRELQRRGVSDALREAKGCALVVAADTGDVLLTALAEGVAVDVALVYVERERPEGFHTLGILQNRHPEVRTLAVCATATDEITARALRVNALGMVQEDVKVPELYVALAEVGAGRIHVNAHVKGLLTRRVRQLTPRGPDRPLLTKREVETLLWKAAHLSESEIANKMFLKPSTVHTNMRDIRAKLHVRSGAAAVRSAQQQGLLPRVITP
jgi:DNA-binding NarL/FixJ family response regulator